MDHGLRHKPYRSGAALARAAEKSRGAALPQYLRKTLLTRHIPDYAAALSETHDYSQATALAFKGADMAVFQENFREFWLKRRGNARHYDPLDK